VKSFIKSYFSYSRRQFRGIFVLISLIILVWIAPIILRIFEKEKVWDHIEYKNTIDQILKEEPPKEVFEYISSTELFAFNPNTVSKEELLELGFNKQQSATLLNYRKAGGKFLAKDDLKKVYGITEDFYLVLEPYILIQGEKEKVADEVSETNLDSLIVKDKKSVFEKQTLKLTQIVELNSADSIELIKIPGIGPSFAKRIISFRNFVGGFYNKEQLTEIYGFTAEKIKNIEPYISIDTALIKKIDLNQADFKTLNKHPYIEYAQTKNLIKYRELMGKYSSVEEIIINHLMDSAGFFKVKPYLIIN